MKEIKFRTIYNHANPVSPHGGVSMTDQQYKKECDIDEILRQFSITGRLPVSREGVSGDFSEIGDYQRCLDKINKAKEEFLKLPSDLRARFGNDPTAYVSFVLDPSNNEECVRLGLKTVRKPEDPSVVEVLKSIDEKLSVTPKEDKPA